MIDRIHRMFEVIDGCDWPRLGEFFTRDCVYDRPGYAMIEGLDRLTAFYRDERIIASGRHRIAEHFTGANGLIVTGDFTGRLRNGNDAYVEFADCYAFAGDLIRRRRTYFFTPLV